MYFIRPRQRGQQEGGEIGRQDWTYRGTARIAALVLAAAAAMGSAVVGATVGSAAAKTRRPDVAACALGRVPAELTTALPAAIATAEQRFASSLHGVSGADRQRAEQAFATGVAAYLYGIPPVRVRLTVQRFPRNVLVGIAKLATPATRTVVAPNHDTLYSVSQLDLGAGPLVVDAPATGGRYSVLQLLDAYTNAAYIGAGSERDHHQAVAIVPPGWQGSLPAGVRVIRSPTKLVWLLGRTLVDGPADVAAAKKVMQRYSLTPLGDWMAGKRNAAVVLDSFAGNQRPISTPTGLAFFDALGDALAADPPPARDACALRAFAKIGVGPGLHPTGGADLLVTRALVAAAHAGPGVIDRIATIAQRRSRQDHNGWSFSPPDTAKFGTDYAHRALVGARGLAANVPSQAIYPHAYWDRDGHRLTGRHNYVIHFRRAQLPPVRSFWSITMYGRSLYLVPNAIHRYTVGDRTRGLHYGRDGSLTIYIRHKPPPARQRANWLPAPVGRFELHLRLYEPKRTATNGRWEPPVVRRTN